MYSLLALIVQRTSKLMVKISAKKQVIRVTGLEISVYFNYKVRFMPKIKQSYMCVPFCTFTDVQVDRVKAAAQL